MRIWWLSGKNWIPLKGKMVFNSVNEKLPLRLCIWSVPIETSARSKELIGRCIATVGALSGWGIVSWSQNDKSCQHDTSVTVGCIARGNFSRDSESVRAIIWEPVDTSSEMLYSILEGSLSSGRMNWEEQVQRKAWSAVRGSTGEPVLG